MATLNWKFSFGLLPTFLGERDQLQVDPTEMTLRQKLCPPGGLLANG